MVCVLLFCPFATRSQYEHVAILDPGSLALRDIANIPAITYVSGDNTAIDPNARRFFFQGRGSNADPFTLYTVSTVSGATVFSPLSPGNVSGLQFDPGTNVLYCIQSVGSVTQFGSLDPATGVFSSIGAIKGFSGYLQSAYDAHDHWYMVGDGQTLFVINAVTGALLYTDAVVASQLVFDNLNQTLYGLHKDAASLSFISIDLSSGALTTLSTMPTVNPPQAYAYSIDPVANRYYFVATDPSQVCVKNNLYTVDLSSGSLLSTAVYPYLQSTSVFSVGNVIEWSFDPAQGKLFALHWDPPPPVVPTLGVTISTTTNPVCAGSAVNFVATLSPGFSTPMYQWQQNGQPVGSNSNIFSASSVQTGDAIRCIVTDNVACSVYPGDTSNAIVLRVQPTVQPAVSIEADKNKVCASVPVTFDAVLSNAGQTPQLQWQVNGQNAGDGSNPFVSSTLQDQDRVQCVLTGSLGCSLPATSNTIEAMIKAVPELVMPRDTVITPSQTVLLVPRIQGEILSYQWTPVGFLNVSGIADPLFTPGKTTTYTLLLTAANACQVSGQTKVTVDYPLRMPNAFTPNGDGRNDVFRIPPSIGRDIGSFSIYNRWGQRIFETRDGTAGWDGNFDGLPQGEGTYVWEIEFIDPILQTNVRSQGTVELIR